MNPSYLDIFQVSLAIFTVLGLCALTGYKKMFNLNDASIVRKIFYMIITPALFFREIGQSEFKYETWLPFINEILVQITLHVLLALIVFILPFENKKKMFIQSVFSNCYTNTIIIGYPLVRGVYGLEYLYVPTTINIVLNAIIVPLHTLMVLPHKAPQEAEENYEEDQSEDGIEKGTGAINEIVVDSSDSEHQSSSNEHSDNDNNNHPNDQNNQPKDETHKIKKISVDHHENDDEENNGKDTTQTTSKWKAIMWTLVTPTNIFTIIGIIWSATGYSMPLFFDTTSNNLEKAIIGCGLFSIGIFLWFHPFRGCPVLLVIFNMLIRFGITPLVTIFWCWVLKMDNTVSQICVLLHSMAEALAGYIMTINSGSGMDVASFSFYWSYFLFFPAIMIWAVVINEAGLFKD